MSFEGFFFFSSNPWGSSPLPFLLVLCLNREHVLWWPVHDPTVLSSVPPPVCLCGGGLRATLTSTCPLECYIICGKVCVFAHTSRIVHATSLYGFKALWISWAVVRKKKEKRKTQDVGLTFHVQKKKKNNQRDQRIWICLCTVCTPVKKFSDTYRNICLTLATHLHMCVHVCVNIICWARCQSS